jgi:hypothetical protein
MQAGYTDREFEYVNLLYNTDSTGKSMFAKRIFANQVQVPLTSNDDMMPQDANWHVEVGTAVASVLRNGGMLAGSATSRSQSDSRRPVFVAGTQSEELVVTVNGQWLVPSLATGYTVEKTTTVRCRLVDENRAGNHELLFASDLGMEDLAVRFEKRFDQTPELRRNIEGQIAELPNPKKIDVYVGNKLIMTVDGAESERKSMLRAVRYITTLVCAISSLRVICALREGRRVALLRTTQDIVAAVYTVAVSGITTHLPALQIAENVASSGVGESFIVEISSNAAFSMNTLTPLRRIAERQYVARESEIDKARLTKQWLDSVANLLDTQRVSVENRDSLLLHVARLTTIDDAVQVLKKLFDYPSDIDTFARKFYTAVRDKAYALFKRANVSAAEGVAVKLGECADVNEAIAIAKELTSGDELKRIGILYLLAKEIDGQSAVVFGDTKSSVQLADQLRSVTTCQMLMAEDLRATFAKVKAFIENDQLHLVEPGGAYSRESLREQIYASLAAASSGIAQRILEQSSVARSVAVLLQKSVSSAAGVPEPNDEPYRAAYKEIEAPLKKALANLPAKAAPTRNELTLAQSLLESLVQRIQNAAFVADGITPIDARRVFARQLKESERALKYAGALQAYYANPSSAAVTDMLKGVSDIVADDLAVIDAQDAKQDKLLIDAIDANLQTQLNKASAYLTDDLKATLETLRKELSPIKSDIGSQEFARRVATQLEKFRRLVQLNVAQTADAVTEGPDKFAPLAGAMKLLIAAGYVSGVERELAIFAGTDQKKIDESITAAERRLARGAAVRLIELIGIDAVVRGELGQEFVAYESLLRKIEADNGSAGYVPIVDRAALGEYAQNKQSLRASLNSIEIYGQQQTSYFRDAVRRAVPSYEVALLAPVALKDEQRRLIVSQMQPLNSELADLIRKTAALEQQSPTQLDANNVVIALNRLFAENASDRAVLLALRSAKQQCDAYLATLSRIDKPIYSEAFEKQIGAIVKIANACADLLAQLTGAPREQKTAIPPVNWENRAIDVKSVLGDFEVDPFAAPVLFGVKYSEAERQQLVTTFTTSVSVSEMRKTVDLIKEDDEVAELEKAPLERFVSAGESLRLSTNDLARALERLQTVGTAETGALDAALQQMQAARQTMQVDLLRLRRAVEALPKIGDVKAASEWSERSRRLDIIVAQAFSQLPAPTKQDFELTEAKVRVADLEQLRATATQIGDQIKDQLKQIETAAVDASKSLKDADGLREKITKLKVAYDDLVKGIQIEDEAPVPLGVLLDNVTQTQANILAERDRVDQLGSLVKDAKKLLDEARTLKLSFATAEANIVAEANLVNATIEQVRANLPPLREKVAILRGESKILDDELAKLPSTGKELAQKLARLEEAVNIDSLTERIANAKDNVERLTTSSGKNLATVQTLAAQAASATSGIVQSLKQIEELPTPAQLTQRGQDATLKIEGVERALRLYSGIDKRVDAAVKDRRRLEAAEKDVKTLPTADELDLRVTDALRTADAVRLEVAKLASVDTATLIKEVRVAQTKIAQIDKLPDADRLLVDVEGASAKQREFQKVLAARDVLNETFTEANIIKFKETRKLISAIEKLDPAENYEARIRDAKEKSAAVQAARQVDLNALTLTVAAAEKYKTQLEKEEARVKVLLDAQADKVSQLNKQAEALKSGVENLQTNAAELGALLLDENAATARTEIRQSMDFISAQIAQDANLIRDARGTQIQAERLAALAKSVRETAAITVRLLPANRPVSLQAAFEKLSTDVERAFATFAAELEKFPPPLGPVSSATLAPPPAPAPSTQKQRAAAEKARQQAANNPGLQRRQDEQAENIAKARKDRADQARQKAADEQARLQQKKRTSSSEQLAPPKKPALPTPTDRDLDSWTYDQFVEQVAMSIDNFDLSFPDPEDGSRESRYRERLVNVTGSVQQAISSGNDQEFIDAKEKFRLLLNDINAYISTM